MQSQKETKTNTKILSQNNLLTKFSFNITYILLLTTATITFIEAIRTTQPFVRHILNLETCISVVASYFYYLFLNKIEDEPVNWNEISELRYIDWSITTPMMILALCLVLSNNINQIIHLKTIAFIVFFNYLMLCFGYLGETQRIDKVIADIFGFVFFVIMFYLIYVNYVKPKYSSDNIILYSLYLGIWSIYGIVYLFENNLKNIIMNILDLTSKCLIGLGLWVYYTKIIKY
jgi:bacteriorhodopsin